MHCLEERKGGKKRNVSKFEKRDDIPTHYNDLLAKLPFSSFQARLLRDDAWPTAPALTEEDMEIRAPNVPSVHSRIRAKPAADFYFCDTGVGKAATLAPLPPFRDNSPLGGREAPLKASPPLNL